VAGEPAIDVAVADAEGIWSTAIGQFFRRQAA
jgi:hypothetical protein